MPVSLNSLYTQTPRSCVTAASSREYGAVTSGGSSIYIGCFAECKTSCPSGYVLSGVCSNTTHTTCVASSQPSATPTFQPTAKPTIVSTASQKGGLGSCVVEGTNSTEPSKCTSATGMSVGDCATVASQQAVNYCDSYSYSTFSGTYSAVTGICVLYFWNNSFANPDSTAWFAHSVTHYSR